MDFWQIIRNGSGVGGFDSLRQVTREEIERIMWAAHRAPTLNGVSGCHIEIIRHKEVKEGIARDILRNEGIRHASVFIIVCGNKKRASERYKQDKAGRLCIQDATIVSCFLFLAARALEMTCRCFFEFPEKRLSQLLDLKQEFLPVSVLAIGYPVRP